MLYSRAPAALIVECLTSSLYDYTHNMDCSDAIAGCACTVTGQGVQVLAVVCWQAEAAEADAVACTEQAPEAAHPGGLLVLVGVCAAETPQEAAGRQAKHPGMCEQ
jgi:hypothetical protein